MWITPGHWFISLQIIQLVEGKASAYVFASIGCKKWDTCAPEAILHAVGGKFSHFLLYRTAFKTVHVCSSAPSVPVQVNWPTCTGTRTATMQTWSTWTPPVFSRHCVTTTTTSPGFHSRWGRPWSHSEETQSSNTPIVLQSERSRLNSTSIYSTHLKESRTNLKTS